MHSTTPPPSWHDRVPCREHRHWLPRSPYLGSRLDHAFALLRRVSGSSSRVFIWRVPSAASDALVPAGGGYLDRRRPVGGATSLAMAPSTTFTKLVEYVDVSATVEAVPTVINMPGSANCGRLMIVPKKIKGTANIPTKPQ